MWGSCSCSQSKRWFDGGLDDRGGYGNGSQQEEELEINSYGDWREGNVKNDNWAYAMQLVIISQAGKFGGYLG